MFSIGNGAIKNAIEINETVIFEYDIHGDSIDFSDNISSYIPLPSHLDFFVEKINKIGKIHEEDIQKAIKFFTSATLAGKLRMEYIRFLDLSGDFRWYQMKARLGRSADNGSEVLFGTMSYIDDDSKKYNEERAIERVSTTGLIKKDALFEEVDNYLKVIPKDVIPVMITVEVDDYDSFINTYGHIIGEGVQLEVSRILKKTFRGSDLIGQINKSRFVVFMKGVHGSNIVLERSRYINSAVNEFYETVEGDRKVTVSIGASIIHANEASAQSLYEKSLAALEDAHRSGNNTYILYAEDMARLDSSINPLLSTKEMELVRSILDPISTWAYAVDENLNLLYRNDVLDERLGNKCEGFCYEKNKGYSCQCDDCPLKHMDENMESYDSVVYSPSLHIPMAMRATKIVMRDGRPIYVIAAVNENIDEQLEIIKEAENRITKGLYEVQDIVWDVNISRNTCIRVKERGVGSIMDLRIKNYKKLVDYYAENVVNPEDRNVFLELTDNGFLKRMVKSGRSVISREIRIKNTRDEYQWMGFYAVVLSENNQDDKVNDNNDLRVMIVAIDINDYKKAVIGSIETKIKYEIMREKSDIMSDMALSYERHENVNEMIGILVYEYTVADKNYYLCSSFEDVFEIDRHALVDEWSVLNSLKCHEADQNIYSQFIENIKTSNLVEKVTVRLLNRFGVYVWYTINVQTLRGLNNDPVRFLGTFQNVDSEMKIKSEMEYRADYDSLTDVYNAEAFYRTALNMISERNDIDYTIFCIDIDKFRLINDTYGIEGGNRLLSEVGAVLKEMTFGTGIVKRYQADIFTVLIPYTSDNDLISFMTELTARVNEISSIPTQITFTFGIYKIVNRDLPIRIMCDRARAAKKQIKGSSSASNYGVYDDAIRLKLREQAEIEEQMENALKNNEFVMFLQPQIDVKTKKLAGAEALVRWNHPIKGIMVPFQFLDLFESNGFIVKLDMFMWEQACSYLKKLRANGINIPIAVNISRAHIGVTNLTETFVNLVKKYDIEPSALELEITENLFMGDLHELFDEMSALKQHGFKIHMDDFGSAYSSLNMLRNAPVDTLKIDKFFFDEIMTTERGKIIVEASVRMAKQLGLTTIAEGVEMKEQLDFLESIECDIVQGYYFSKPVSIDKFEEFMGEYL